MLGCYGRHLSPAYRKTPTARQRGAVFTGGVACTQPVRTAVYRTRIRWLRVAALLGVIAAIATAFAERGPVSSSATGPPPAHLPRGGRPGPLGETDGAVPEGTTVWADAISGVAR